MTRAELEVLQGPGDPLALGDLLPSGPVEPGARWKVIVASRNIFVGVRQRESMLIVRAVDPYERFAWHVLSPKLDAEVSIAATGPDRTQVTVTSSRGSPTRALQRLYDLVQTAAGLDKPPS